LFFVAYVATMVQFASALIGGLPWWVVMLGVGLYVVGGRCFSSLGLTILSYLLVKKYVESSVKFVLDQMKSFHLASHKVGVALAPNFPENDIASCQ
jgi:hypothetical protein